LVIITVIIVAVAFCCLLIIIIFYPRQSLFPAHTHTTHNNSKLSILHTTVWWDNKCVSRLARPKSHHTALRYAADPNSECSPSHGAQFRLPTAIFM